MPTEVQKRTAKALLDAIPDDATILDALGASIVTHMLILDSIEDNSNRRALALKASNLLIERYAHASANFHA